MHIDNTFDDLSVAERKKQRQLILSEKVDDHPFHLYEGDRLDDMVESIKDHGVLNPVIVRTTEDGYE